MKQKKNLGLKADSSTERPTGLSPEGLASLKRGIEDAKAGRTSKLDIDFSQFLDEDEEN